MLAKLEQKQNYNKNVKNKNLIFTPIFERLYEKSPLIFDRESSKIFRTY